MSGGANAILGGFPCEWPTSISVRVDVRGEVIEREISIKQLPANEPPHNNAAFVPDEDEMTQLLGDIFEAKKRSYKPATTGKGS